MWSGKTHAPMIMSAEADSHSQHQQEGTPCGSGRMQTPRPAPGRARDRKFQNLPNAYKFLPPAQAPQFTPGLSPVHFKTQSTYCTRCPISQYMLQQTLSLSSSILRYFNTSLLQYLDNSDSPLVIYSKAETEYYKQWIQGEKVKVLCGRHPPLQMVAAVGQFWTEHTLKPANTSQEETILKVLCELEGTQTRSQEDGSH